MGIRSIKTSASKRFGMAVNASESSIARNALWVTYLLSLKKERYEEFLDRLMRTLGIRVTGD